MIKQEKKLSETKVFRDPIHKSIHVDQPLIWELIDTKEFQRLRRIRQLGGTFQVYPTAEHSRFTHSLGVFEILRRMLTETNLAQYLDQRQALVVLVAGLLHDVGHGPFSHTFENVFDTTHEDYTVAIIQGNTQINQVLNAYDSTLIEEICQVIAKTHPNQLMVSLISSHIDADRMDYLLRDAYFCGVSYGQFDLERLLRTMCVKDNHVAFKKSGSFAIEDYIFARYHMYRQVYMHPVSLAFDMMLTCLLKRAKQLYQDDYLFIHEPYLLIPFFNEHVTLDAYLALDDASIFVYIQAFSHEQDEILSNLANQMLTRQLFELVTLEDQKQIEALKAYHETLPAKIRDYQFILQESSETLNKWLGKIESKDILLLDDDQTFMTIAQASDVVNAILQHDDYVLLAKVYINPQWYEKDDTIKTLLTLKKKA